MPAAAVEAVSSLNDQPKESVATGLLEVLGRVVDPRGRRGRRYSAASLLLTALAATLAGAKSFVAIGEWVADAPAGVLARLGLRGVPSEKAMRKLLQRLDADALDAAIGAWVWLRAGAVGGTRVLSFDGKSLRGARDAAGALVHLLSGVCQATGSVIAQVAVPGKTSEVPMLRKLLETLDIAGRVITADALHTCRGTAQLIVDRGAHYVLCVKANQPTLHAMVKSLPWKQIPIQDRVKGKPAHGRVETRVFKATTVDSALGGIDFPGAKQVLRIERTRLTRKTGKKSTEIVYAVTSMAVGQADHHMIAEMLRKHWHIEARIHWVRDVTFSEDLSQIRTASSPQAMASLRNLAISLLRLSGHHNIAEALRHHGRDHERPLALLLTC